MPFQIGDRVELIATGKPGTIAALLPGGRVEVRLDGGLGHLPAPPDALRPLTGSSAPASDPKPTALTETSSTPSQQSPAGPGGVQLAFDPSFDAEGNPETYQLYLLNGSPHRLLYEVKVKTGETQRFQKFGPLAPRAKLNLTRIDYSWLNERLSVEMDLRAAVEGGTGPRHFHVLRVKPKQFFNNYREVPSLSRGAHLFTLFERIDTRSVADRAEQTSLRELTRAQLRQSGKGAAPAPPPPPTNDPAARAAFNDVLDLHLSALVKDPATIARDRALETQLRAFDRYMDQALRMDVPQVYIIHGVGDGVLKAAIHKRLQTVPFVRHFHNSYHPRYGYGATEVLFEL